MTVYTIRRDKNGNVKSMTVNKKATKKFNSWVRKNRNKKRNSSHKHHSSSSSSLRSSSSSKTKIEIH